VHIGNNVHINVCEPVVIEGKSGIGMECMIFTHSSGNGQNIFYGYPSLALPVTIKQHVSLYSRVIIAPGVTVGEGTTVGANTFVGKSIMGYALFGGNPCVLLKEFSPLTIDEGFEFVSNEIEKFTIKILKSENICIYDYLGEYIALLKEYNKEEGEIISEKYKIKVIICYQHNNTFIDNITFFDLKNQKVFGHSSSTSEKVRDVLRRLGIIIEIHDSYEPTRLSAKNLIMNNIEES